MTVVRRWVEGAWLAAHPDDADELLRVQAAGEGVPAGVEPTTLYSPWRKAYLYTWDWTEQEVSVR